MSRESHKYQRHVPNSSESRWSDSNEIKSASTIKCIQVDGDSCDGCGIIVISDGLTSYVDNSDTHTIFFGSTGSMKTRRGAMPLINTIALAGESFIATDPKGELHKKTSGMLSARGYNIVVLNFRDMRCSSTWNPLELPYNFYHRHREDEAISMMNDFLGALAEPYRKGAKDPYFIEMSFSMAFAYLMFFIETATLEQANLSDFAKFFAMYSTPEKTEELSNYLAKGSIAHTNLMGTLTNKDARSTFGNISSGVSAMLYPFITQKALGQMLLSSSFDVTKIGKEKTAIYIIVPDEKTTLHFMVTAFIKQVYEVLINEAQIQENKNLPMRVNFILDEFCNIPAIPDMSSMISAARSRNMRFFLMTQGMRQLRQKYGDDADTIKGNCDNWVFLTSREYDLLKEISNLCGMMSYTDTDGSIKKRSLISISELQRLNKERGQALILHGRHYPYVTELPDIDEYTFKAYSPVSIGEHRSKKIASYDAGKVMANIEAGKRPLPFSVEAFGYETFFDRKNVMKSDIFDW
jgi:type IV secretion system protein VirD4